VGTNGEVMHLSEEERQKRIDETNKQIKENCSS
jgi:dihydrodipicolinate synthase/N-acetylneuraminate lyase